MNLPYAQTRSTNIGGFIESFIDDNREKLSPELFGMLEDLAENVNNHAEELERENADLQERVNELVEENEILEKKLEESK
jgi:predicted nuclease with TOPRIM domain